jgi:hypothetical protein
VISKGLPGESRRAVASSKESRVGASADMKHGLLDRHE